MTEHRNYFQSGKDERTILIVDDDSFFRTVLKDIVVNAGYTVIGEAEDGEDAIKKACRLKPDVIILDLVMPLKNGIDTVKELKKANGCRHIIICSSIKGEHVIGEAKSLGVSAYVNKPIVAAELLEALRALPLK